MFCFIFYRMFPGSSKSLPGSRYFALFLRESYNWIIGSKRLTWSVIMGVFLLSNRVIRGEHKFINLIGRGKKIIRVRPNDQSLMTKMSRKCFWVIFDNVYDIIIIGS